VIVYLDTSSLVKKYLRERGSVELRSLTRSATQITTSLVAYAETLAALAIARRTTRIHNTEYDRLSTELKQDWRTMEVMDVDSPLVLRAGDLVETHPLHGFDAIHLASALRLQEGVGETITFSAFDDQLNRAARAEGLQLP
jgi:predicted nucleic acid-binding protein